MKQALLSHMDYQLEAREFANKEIIPIANSMDDDEVFPKELALKMRSAGFLGSIISPASGGAGKNFVLYAMMIEEIAKASSSARSLITVQDMVASAINNVGTEYQKE